MHRAKKIHLKMWSLGNAFRHRQPGRIDKIRRRYPDLGIDDMAIVSCFFNNAGYRSRIRNYDAFSRGIDETGLPLRTVELAFGHDPFQLRNGCGDLIQLRSSHVMWQKERLLNIGISTLLDQGFKKIIWLDGDIVLDDPETWAWQMAAALEENPLCQVFSDAVIESSTGAPHMIMSSAVRYWRQTGEPLLQPPRWPNRRAPMGLPRGQPGFGWGAHSDLLRRINLYDRAIVGGGDSLIFAASCGAHRNAGLGTENLFTSPLPRCPTCGRQCDSPELRRDYHEWADGWYKTVGGRVGYVDHPIRHLYHGDLSDRGYDRRRGYLHRHAFAPSRDIELNQDRCWVWKSDNLDLQTDVLRYLSNRREDGPVPASEV